MAGALFVDERGLLEAGVLAALRPLEAVAGVAAGAGVSAFSALGLDFGVTAGFGSGSLYSALTCPTAINAVSIRTDAIYLHSFVCLH